MQAEPQENNPANNASVSSAPPAERLLKILAGVLIVMFPVGLVIMFTDFGQNYLWTTAIFLGLEAIITFIILIKLADLLSVVITTAVIFLASWFIEYWGVSTTVPFGSYSYSHVLAPLIGGVPLAIMFAWFTVAASSLLAARFLLNGSSEISAISVASVFVLATDILLEPFASFINNFWVWNDSAIPMQNFVSWFAIGLVFTATFSQLIKWNSDRSDKKLYSSIYYKLPLLVLAINIINFSAVNLANGYIALTFIGLLMFVVTAVISVLMSYKKTADPIHFGKGPGGV